MSALIDAVLQEIRPEVPGCPAPMLRHNILESARRFANDTGILRDTVSFTSVPSQEEYTLAPLSAENEVYGLYSLRRGQELLSAVPEHPSNRFERLSRPFFYTFSNLKVQLYPTPEEAESYSAELYVRPKVDTIAPDLRLVPYVEHIALWARYRLLSMMGTPWANNDAAVIARIRYDAIRNDARWSDLRANTRANVYVKQRPFA